MFFSASNSVQIHLSKPNYSPGELVSGNVTLNIRTATVLNSLNLIFKGEESVTLKQVITTTAGNTTTTTTISHITSKIWVQNYVELQAGPVQYQPGTYVLPIQFALPNDIPGSARFKPANDGHAYISYVFNVEGDVPGIFTSNLRHSAEISVIEIFNRPIQPTNIEQEAMITSMCCIDMGSLRFRACLDRNSFRPGAVAILQLYIDNSCSEVGYRYVSVKLRQSYDAVAGPSSYREVSTKTLIKNRTPSIPAGDIVHATIPLALPTNTIPSVHGVSLSLCYQIQVVFSLKNSIDVYGDVPISIYALRTLLDEGTTIVEPMSYAQQPFFDSQVPQNPQSVPQFVKN